VALAPDSPDGSMSGHAVTGVFWSVIQSWGGRVVSTVVFIVLGRLLDPQDFGLVSLGSVLIDVGALLTVSGFHRALVQREDLDAKHLDAAFWSSIAFGTILCLVTLASAGFIADQLGEPRFANVLRALSATFLITALGAVPNALLHRRMAFKAFAVRQLFAITAGGTAGVVCAILGAGAWALVAQSLVSAVVGTAVVFVKAHWRPRFRFSKRHWRDIAGFGTLSMAIDMLDLMKNRFDDLLIGLVLGTTALGYYGVAYRTYAIALEVITYSISAVAFPIFSRIIADRERSARAILTTTRFAVCVTIPVFVGLALLADQALLGLFGEQWRPAVTVLRILCVTAALGATVSLSRDVVMAAGKPRLELYKMLLATALLCAGFAVGVHWELTGVAYSRVVAAVIIIPVELAILHRVVRFDMRSYVVGCLRPLPACAAMAGAIVAVQQVFDPPLHLGWLLGMTVLGAVVYVFALWLTARDVVTEVVDKVRNRNAATSSA
jgi:PST family polysaccharide transporter